MKKLYFTLLLLVSIYYVSAQNDEGTPVTDIKIIKRVSNKIETQDGLSNKSDLTAKKTTLSTLKSISPAGISSEVGITEGQLTVSLTGSANYTIPIAVPPGINGIEPQLSLTYNSQRGLSGTAARGWDISGVSTITRIPTTKFHDNRIGAVELNHLDRFALDGQRLVIKLGTTGTYGANGTIYETENYSNVKIVSYGIHPNGANYGPAYFIVEYPDGSKAHYGNSIDSRSIMEWSITYWENPQGVRINYFYTITNNTINIASIKYGTLTTASPINEIKYIYEDRIFPESSYIGGQNIIRNKKIKEIKVIGNTIGFRNYVLTSPEGDRISSITEKSGDNTISYNPTSFEYDKTYSKASYLSIETKLNLGNINSQNAATISGDFDGDGNMDSIIYPTIGPDAKKVYWLYTNIQSEDDNIGIKHEVGPFEDIIPTTWLSWNNKIMPQGWTVIKKTATDYTFTVYSTGFTSPIYKQYERVVSIPKTIYPKKVVSGDFNGDGLTDVLIIDSQSPKGNIVSGKRVYFVDLKRDNTANFLTLPGQLITSLSGTARVEVADFNGDGKSDLFVFDTGFLVIYSLNAENKLVVLYKSPSFDSTLSTGYPKTTTTTLPILIGDYNGDGKSDFIIPKAYGSSQWYKYTSTGTTMKKELKSYLSVFSKNDSYNTYNFIPTDFDNDGKTDLIRIQSNRNQSNTAGSIVIGCYPNVNGDFTGNPSWAGTGDKSEINIYALPTYLPQIQQSTTNGITQIKSTLAIAFFNQNKIHFFNSGYDYTKGNTLTSITTGDGVKDLISYIPLDSKYKETDEYQSIYDPSTQVADYPYLDIKIDPNSYVVTKLEKQSATVYKKKLFTYYGAVTNLEGLGFLGFRSTVTTNWHNDSSPIISSMSRFDMDLRGSNVENYTVLGKALPLLASTTQTAKTIIKENDYTVSSSDNLVATQQIILKPNTWIKSGSTFSSKINPGANTSINAPRDFITKSIITYESNLLSNKVFKLRNVNTKEYSGLDNTNSETNSNYDNYNNPIKSTTVLKEGETIVQTDIADISYESSSTPYIVGRPKIKIQSTAVTGDLMTSQESYYYNGAQLLHKIEKKGTNTATISEDNLYDNFGNITKKTITAPGLAPRITDYQYDSSGRFLTKVIDTERLETDFLNNLNNGTLKSVTDAYGITTSYTYDKWFKKLTAKNDKLNKIVSYYYTKSGNEILLTTKGDITDGSYMEDTFDDLGRKIKSGIKDVTGKMSFISYLYDIYDRSYKVSQPYFGSTPTQWNETKFDDYGRVIEQLSFTGRSSTIRHSGLTTTFTDGQKNKIATKNALGSILSIQENTGGTINYNYFANGNLKQTRYNDTDIKIEQDGWGRKTKLTDPTAGTFIYDTNDFGELKTETTQNGGVVTTIERDATGKPIKKTITGPFTNSETIYEYDPTTKLPTVTTFTDKLEAPGVNTIITTLTYDSDYKRVVRIVEDKIGYARFTKLFTYDGLGRIDTETKKAEAGNKSSTVATKYKYQNGALYQILDNTTSQILWQTNALNAKGQIVENTIGNGIKMTNEYDANGYLKKIQHNKTAHPTSNIMTLTTAFNKNTDNLNSRTNSMFGNWNETFEYDDLERLTKFTNSVGDQETQNYEASGKIKDNNLGTYNYEESTKPYQNTSITLTPEALGYYAGREGIYNDSMESKTGWSRAAHNPQCISFDTTMAHTGQSSLRINTTGLTVSYVQSDVVVPINNATDTEYTFSGWVYSDSPVAQLTLFMMKEGETGYYTKYKSTHTSKLKQWILISETVIVPANIKNLSLRLDNVGTGNVWFDEVQIRKTSNAATLKRKLLVDYNAYKSPVKIEEIGVDKINFTYNNDNQRSTMFYGGFEDKLLRQYRKHYAADGSMEIKENRATGVLEFVTYIGGDGYSAPIVAKSDGNNTPNYLYLHRDYQGSIMAITDAAGIVVEKRLYDAWGKISKVQDGAGNSLTELTFLDRGYTGHEHLQSVGLINMNARLYDPMLHRFLSVDNYIQDPTNTQNYNQYGYVFNNPLKYTDPSGNKASGNGKDCVDCGPSEIDQSLIGNGIKTLKDNWDDWGIKDWAKKNLNFKSWGRSWNKFWGKNRDSGPPPNRSSYVNLGDSKTNNNLATTGSLLGGASGVMNELSVVKFYNAAPKGYFAVNYNGVQTLWHDSFKGGTRGRILYSSVQTAKAKASGLKLASKFGGHANLAGSYLGYYGAVDNFVNGDYHGAVREGTANYVGLELAAARGNIAGIGWTIGWNILGPWVTNTEAYNNFFFGKNSVRYQYLERENGWYESRILKD